MKEKLTSAITRVAVNDATFHNKGFVPSYINFIFGNNGCGKSTIAKAIKEKNGLTWESGRSESDFTVLVYNEEFIKRNIASYSDMPGVFTISEQNASVQQQIENATAQLGAAQAALQDTSSRLGEQEGLLGKQYGTFQNICWEKSKDFRAAVSGAMDGRKTKDGFAKALLAQTTAREHDEAELISMYEAAFSSDAATYPELFPADASSLPASPLMEKRILSSSDSPFATFMKAINATNWVRQGHEEFHPAADGRCPYCQRPLDGDFESELTKCFDEEYEADLASLRSFRGGYGNAANAMWRTFADNLKNAYPKISDNLRTYAAVFETFKAKIQINAQRLEEKLASPDKAVTLEDVSGLADQLNRMVSDMNGKIRENNAIVNDKTKKQPQCREFIMEYLAHLLKSDVDAYKTSRSGLQKEIDRLTGEKKAAEKQVKSLRESISDLRKQVVNTAAAVEGINTLLGDTGFQGFYLREKEDTPNVYEVIRSDTKKVAENLSEGERNFIAFLYFHQLVLGSEKADSVVKDKIVVIDDPVSSMDSSSLFVVGALVRDMVAICNPDYVTKDREGDYIRQIFVLTHNAFFHQEVTYKQAQHYGYVSFFEVTKYDNQSEIVPCIQRNAETPSIMENRNPIQNSYAALWDTYREVSTASTLVNVIRQILDYYFLQLCGYDGVSIKDEILKNHRPDFIKKLPDGTEDYSGLHMAASLLQYICTSGDRISDGLNFINTSVDVDCCRRIFESIFRHMGQGQHYDMMMKRSGPH